MSVRLASTHAEYVNPTYVIFCGLHPIVHTQDRGRADRVCNRLNSLSEFFCRKDWESSDQNYKETCWSNDYENFRADSRNFYRVQAVRGMRSDSTDNG